ncbi:hypothetical protein EJ06DRAFT_401242 [Trichodelitschia bisporula]|uniref:Uncharacterized protein n=1 Tax=Trichodelitschia bisporula TaxID=703511 RepID=A0A6G1HXS3_9PEZI|nr:hypothetical protein EJ06DRAFT_401242 [Trichodelitschia bisporula]
MGGCLGMSFFAVISRLGLGMKPHPPQFHLRTDKKAQLLPRRRLLDRRQEPRPQGPPSSCGDDPGLNLLLRSVTTTTSPRRSRKHLHRRLISPIAA